MSDQYEVKLAEALVAHAEGGHEPIVTAVLNDLSIEERYTVAKRMDSINEQRRARNPFIPDIEIIEVDMVGCAGMQVVDMRIKLPSLAESRPVYKDIYDLPTAGDREQTDDDPTSVDADDFARAMDVLRSLKPGIIVVDGVSKKGDIPPEQLEQLGKFAFDGAGKGSDVLESDAGCIAEILSRKGDFGTPHQRERIESILAKYARAGDEAMQGLVGAINRKLVELDSDLQVRGDRELAQDPDYSCQLMHAHDERGCCPTAPRVPRVSLTLMLEGEPEDRIVGIAGSGLGGLSHR